MTSFRNGCSQNRSNRLYFRIERWGPRGCSAPAAVRSVLIAISLTFIAVGMYHRIRAAQSGDRLDRTKEGWLILIGMRLAGFTTFGSTAAWLWNPPWFAWADSLLASHG
jgi:hypothetical protein